jgi:adenosyl cobinamide kinase/adenosyl cobinamide phosphate guanylyltransferase
MTFDFIFAPPYTERVIDRYETTTVVISTAKVTDSAAFAETAISHSEYNKGHWIIVENYYSLEEAKKGHKKWIETITNEPLPAYLEDVSLCHIKQLVDECGLNDWKFPRQIKKPAKTQQKTNKRLLLITTPTFSKEVN